MEGGLLIFSNGVRVLIKTVASATSLTVVSTINVAAGSNYTIYYGATQIADGYATVKNLNINGETGSVFHVAQVNTNIYGVAASASGPHINFYVDDTTHPTGQILMWQSNHQNLCMGCYFDAGTWKSATTTANYRISSGQSAGRLDFDIATGTTAGSGITFNLVMSLITGATSYVNFPGAGGARFQTSGGAASSLNYYEENTGSVTASGALSGTVNYVVIRIGKIVALQFTTVLSGTCSANIITTTAVTTRYRPTTNINQIVLVQNNAATAASLAVLDTSGILTVYGTAAQGNFVNSAACTFFPAAMTFPLS